MNIEDIDTSSDDDDYGDLFANERGRIVKSKPNIRTRKGSKTKRGLCCQGLCVILFVLLLLLSMAGVALYLDPQDGLDIIRQYGGGDIIDQVITSGADNKSDNLNNATSIAEATVSDVQEIQSNSTINDGASELKEDISQDGDAQSLQDNAEDSEASLNESSFQSLDSIQQADTSSTFSYFYK